MTFKTKLLAAAALAFAAAPACADERPTMAVFPLIVSDMAKTQFGAGKLDAEELTRQIEEAVRATRRFAMFERSGAVLQRSVLEEQDFAKSGQALRDAAQSGKLNNVQFIAQPILTQLNLTVRKSQDEERPGQYRYASSGALSVSLKVLDTTSGEIMFQTTRETNLTAPSSGSAGQSGPNDEPLVRSTAWRILAKDSGSKLASAVVGSMFPIQVMSSQGADIFVNRGEGGGIATGERYVLYSVGAALIDPATNEKLGETEEARGDVQVVRVNPRFSIVRPIGALNGSVKAGDILRPAL